MLEVLVVLRDLGKQLAEGRSVSSIEAEKPLVLICSQHHDGETAPAGNLLRFARERSVHQGAELVLCIL